MKCHYEVLSVERNADDAEIKRAYRKLALQLHPDKHIDEVEEYTRRFREVQAAYDVLSDKQERAWYDKHREAVLRGGEDFVDDAIDLMQFFNPSIYSGYDDGPTGFYNVFRTAFQNIAEEEEPYLEGDISDYEVPEFGDSTSSYDDVVKVFYSYWLGYCTKKSYVWKEKYDIRQAPNRPTQRLMEKENKKMKDVCKRKRNEDVRALVSYVRKRDKRVQVYRKQMEERQEQQKLNLEKKIEEDKRNRKRILEDYKEQEWMTFDDSKLDAIDSHFDDDFGKQKQANSSCEEVLNVEEFYCVACEKTFKSEKALANHEKSKKHRENVELIKAEMVLGDELLGDLDGFTQDDKNSRIANTGSDTQTNNGLLHSTDSLLLNKLKINESSAHQFKVKRKMKNVNVNIEEDDDRDDVENDLNKEQMLSKDSLALPRRKTKKAEMRDSTERVRQQHDATGYVFLGSSSIMDSIRISKNQRPSKSERKRMRKKLMENESAQYDCVFSVGDSDDNSTDTDDDDSIHDENFQHQLLDSVSYNKTKMSLKGKTKLRQRSFETDLQDSPCDENECKTTTVAEEPNSLVGNFKRAVLLDSVRYNKEKMEHHGKQRLQQPKEIEIDSDNDKSTTIDEKETKKNLRKKRNNEKDSLEIFKCDVCGKDYPTRNKLFNHIKTEGHAVTKDNGRSAKNKGRKK